MGGDDDQVGADRVREFKDLIFWRSRNGVRLHLFWRNFKLLNDFIQFF